MEPLAAFAQQMLNGLVLGAIYGSLALAIALVYRATKVINFAQGEMAMVSAFIAWAIYSAGANYWLAVFVALIASFCAGFAIERFVIQPVRSQDHMTLVMVTLGVYLILHGGASWAWGTTARTFPTPFRGLAEVAGLTVSWHIVAVLIVLLLVVTSLTLFLFKTNVGLALRAVSSNRYASQLVGVRVGRIIGVTWGVAALLGAIAGVLVAPVVILDTNLMTSIIIYSFAGAALGGLDSPYGAVVGGLIFGVLQSLSTSYISILGSQFGTVIALITLVAILLLRPSGLFGIRQQERV